jgi:hypothetical protein
MFHFLQKWDKNEVLFFSINSRNKNKLVANGILGSKDRTYVVEGNMLGEQYVAVSIRGSTNLGDENWLDHMKNSKQ